MVDFHSHILYGVDDGSKNIDMSRMMINAAIEDGTTIIAATPHFIKDIYETPIDEYKEKFETLKSEYKSKIEIIPSQEIMINKELEKDLKSGRVFGYNNTKTILVEFNLFYYPLYAERIFYNLIKDGYKIILAHPERNKALRDDPSLIYHLIDLGLYCQVNSGSLDGIFGESIQKFAEKLVRKNLIHVVGSDAHSNRTRNTKISNAYNIIQELNPELYNHIVLNSKKLIKGYTIDRLEYKSWDDKKKKFNILNFIKNKF